ncbi:MAG: type II toxin-antitoxin system RelE/ParE family toxin [Pseudomonadota bacterium]
MNKPILYKVKITESCEKALAILKRHDRSIVDALLVKAEDLAFMPDKKGKPLVGALAGLRSRRAVGGRYRIIYRIDETSLIVEVIFVGIRREGSGQDVYRQTGKMHRTLP